MSKQRTQRPKSPYGNGASKPSRQELPTNVSSGPVRAVNRKLHLQESHRRSWPQRHPGTTTRDHRKPFLLMPTAVGSIPPLFNADR
jgi:hypothetical protein